MEPIRIAFLSEHVYSLFNPKRETPFGGAEVDLYNLAVYLARNPRFSVTFYVGDFGQTDKPEIFQNVKLQKIKMFGWHGKTLRQKAIFYKNLWETLFESDADIILTEMASHLVGWAAIFFKILKNKRYIHRLASDQDTTYTHPSTINSRRIYYLYRLGLKKADMIFSQTQQQQKMLKERMGVDSQVVPNGFFINPDIDFENKTDILWVGRCAPVKRADLFIELAKRLPHLSFLMIMPPPFVTESKSFKEEAEQIVREAKALPNLTYKGQVPFSEIQANYNRARLFVNTSEYEGFPNAFIQACLGGTPIVSLNVDPDGFITRNHLGICCQGSLETLIKEIEALSEAKIKNWGTNALNYAKENHDIKRMGGLYEKAILELTVGTTQA